MNCIVRHKDGDLSFKMRCVAVESERVFGDVIVTHRNETIKSFGEDVDRIFKREARNQAHELIEAPDFMAMNGRRVIRHRRSVPLVETNDKQPEFRRFKSADESLTLNSKIIEERNRRKTYPAPLVRSLNERRDIVVVSSLVDQLLLDIYGLPGGDRGRSESESTVSSPRLAPQHCNLQRKRLFRKNVSELKILVGTLCEHVNQAGGLLIRQLRRRDHLIAKRDKQYDVITAHLQARSKKRSEDTKMKFSVAPQPGESGFTQWLDAMKMVARLPGGIPPEFRKRLWLTLSERHLQQRGVDWRQAEKLCFNEWSNPDDEELGIQIVKDLHRTGCSLFCGAAGRDNQAVLRRVLLGFARWNKSVGYCQGLNVLAALVLQVMDRAEAASVKVMIYLIEGVLPEGYFADNLRGLSVDMAVFRDLLRIRLPKLSRHLEALQSDAKDKATGSSYEPPLTNVFTMQWFLTLFCHCLPQEAVLRVWDLIFLEGDEVLLRTALAIWEGLADRIMTVTSADEFYSIMGVLTREMLEFTDTNSLIKAIVSTGPLIGVTALREKHRYNITPWARRLSDDDETETEEDERLAVAAAMFGMSQRGKRERETASSSSLQTVAASNDRERLALDISTLKQQYAKLRERQRQAHIILSAACARQSLVPTATSQAMNHLLVGKSALVSGKTRQLGPPPGPIPPRTRLGTPHSPRNPSRKDKQGVTLHWKDTKRRKEMKNEVTESSPPITSGITQPPTTCSVPTGEATLSDFSASIPPADEMPAVITSTSPRLDAIANVDSDSDSTSTELCDEPDRLSDVDSEELTSNSDCYIMATDDEKSPRRESPLRTDIDERQSSSLGTRESKVEDATGEGNKEFVGGSNLEGTSSSISEITDQICRLSADREGGNYVENKTTSVVSTGEESSTTFSGTTDIDIEKKSTHALDSYDFLNVASNPEDYSDVESKNEDLVLGCAEYDATINSEVEVRKSNSQQFDPGVESIASDSGSLIDRIDSKKLFDYSSPDLRSSDFDKKLVALDSDVTNQHFASELSFAEPRKETKPFSRSYVIGHLPISPMNLERKLNYSSDCDTPKEKESEEQRRSKANGVIVNISNVDYAGSIEAGKRQVSNARPYLDSSQSPRTPGSEKSSSSGETMGPDSKTSSVTVSPRTPVSLDSRDFHGPEKSAGSSISSDSKTLTLRSVGSEEQDGKSKTTDSRMNSYGKPSSPSLEISFDSLKSKSNLSPKLEGSSSSDSCSLERKKSSEVSFSSDLQSPISANSIKFTSNCKNGRGGTFSDSPVNPCSATSPFYPIARPNEKTPSPYNGAKQKGSATDSEETSPEQRSSIAQVSGKLTVFETRLNRTGSTDEKPDIVEDRKDDFRYSLTEDGSSPRNELDRRRGEEANTARFFGVEYSQRYRMETDYDENESKDRYGDKDTLSPLPREKFDKRGGIFSEKNKILPDRNKDRIVMNEEERTISKDYSNSFERSSSSLDKRFADAKLSSSVDEFGVNNLKKRSSDILEDLRHLEVKTSTEGSSESGKLTKKRNDIMEDLKSLEARRQDTFSDSASGFSKGRSEDSETTSSIPIVVARKQYVIEPKIQIQEDSDSFLNTLARASDSSDTAEDKEPKLGVWTKVKPRKKSDNGRRSSDRALKIIQENSAILHRILTCQAKKRLPDLEEISKEITISPINEEISKIFSPILEKIGLNEHEINEELARINFKDFDQISVTSGSEFDAKINDELSKLSLIDDSEDIDNLDLDEALSRDYLDTREALIDRQINEELSKLLANYEERASSSTCILRQEKCSSSQNISELEGLDLSSISTNVFSHKSSSDSIETKSELGSVQEAVIKTEKFYDYNEKQISYPPPKYNLQDISPKSDIDIYRELEKLDKISSGEMIYPNLRGPMNEGEEGEGGDEGEDEDEEIISTNPYASESLSYTDRISPILGYVSKSEKSFDASPLRSPYDSYKPYDFKSRISPRKTSSNPYSVRSYEKPMINSSSFEYGDVDKSASSSHSYEMSPTRPVLSKETLEFRVRYDDEQPSQKIRGSTDEFALRQFEGEIIDLNKGAAYYDVDHTSKYHSRDERIAEKEMTDAKNLDYKYDESDFYARRKYEDISTQEYSYRRTVDYNRSNSYAMESSKLIKEDDQMDETHLSVRRRESHSLSPSHQFANRKHPHPVNTYLTKLSPSLEDVTKRPVSHPEFIDKINASKYADNSGQGSNNYRKSSLSLGNIGHATRVTNRSLEEKTDPPSPKSQFSPFPIRNIPRKPKELGLKLGLYSPTSPGGTQLKRTH